MIVLTLTDCPPKVRGDLSKWLFEINTGVFVGNVSARVREELWSRVCENVRNGQATMVYGAAGEQKIDFRVHNTTWEPVDYDGIKLMRRPAHKPAAERGENGAPGFSRAAKMQKINRIEAARQRKRQAENYVVIDVETTGLSPQDCNIIEIGALKVVEGEVKGELSLLIRQACHVPEAVSGLTGITDEMLREKGKPLKEALECFSEFIGKDRIVSHNTAFDYSFLRAAFKGCGLKMTVNPSTDTLALARRKVSGVSDYKLTTLAEKMGLDTKDAHRALADCYLTYHLYEKLNEF